MGNRANPGRAGTLVASGSADIPPMSRRCKKVQVTNIGRGDYGFITTGAKNNRLGRENHVGIQRGVISGFPAHAAGSRPKFSGLQHNPRGDGRVLEHPLQGIRRESPWSLPARISSRRTS
jgi:hypothetical protein